MQERLIGRLRVLHRHRFHVVVALSLTAIMGISAGCGPGVSVTAPPSPREPSAASPLSTTSAPFTSLPDPDPSTTAQSTGVPDTGSRSTAPAADDSSATPSLAPVDENIRAAFVEVVELLDPIEVYVPQQLPPASVLADHVWPVMEQALEPDDGPVRPNPWVSSGTTERTAEILIRTPAGWLLFLQNFRGDLGDTPGLPAGNVAGQDAYRYELETGSVVQWSHGGRWYCVYARGDAERVLASLLPVMGLMSR